MIDEEKSLISINVQFPEDIVKQIYDISERLKKIEGVIRDLNNFLPHAVENLSNEIWRDVVGYEGLYQISNLGRVKSLLFGRERILKTRYNVEGYAVIKLTRKDKGKIYPIHKLLAQAFIPNPENKPIVNHKDGNKMNNNLDNLEWVTHSENVKHSYKMGLIKPKRGSENVQSKLSEEEVFYIRKNYKYRDEEFNAHKLAQKFGVATSTIYRVVNNECYKNFDKLD